MIICSAAFSFPLTSAKRHRSLLADADAQEMGTMQNDDTQMVNEQVRRAGSVNGAVLGALVKATVRKMQNDGTRAVDEQV